MYIKFLNWKIQIITLLCFGIRQKAMEKGYFKFEV